MGGNARPDPTTRRTPPHPIIRNRTTNATATTITLASASARLFAAATEAPTAHPSRAPPSLCIIGCTAALLHHCPAHPSIHPHPPFAAGHLFSLHPIPSHPNQPTFGCQLADLYIDNSSSQTRITHAAPAASSVSLHMPPVCSVDRLLQVAPRARPRGGQKPGPGPQQRTNRMTCRASDAVWLAQPS